MILEFLLIFIGALVMVRLVRDYAQKIGLMDIPNDRSAHVQHTPRGAGIGFYLSIALILPLFHFDLIRAYPWTFLAVLLVFIVGVLDDHHDTSPKAKFIVILIGAFLLLFDHIVIDKLGTVFGVPMSLGWFAIPFTLFAVTGFTNALNLIDGLDGLAGTVSIVILGSFMAVGYLNNDLFMIVIAGSFIASLLAFLVFNWHPASIFMGDSGSLTLGFVISVLAIKSLAYLPTVSVLFIAALPILDTLVVMMRRKLNGRSIFSADKCHIHHILKRSFKKNIRKTVLFLGALQLIYALLGLQIDKKTDEGFLLILFLLNVIVVYFFLGRMVKKQQCNC